MAPVAPNAAPAPLALNTRHYTVLAVSAAGGGSSQRTIADSLRLDRATVVALVDTLEVLSLARRARSRDDRRANAVECTGPSGLVRTLSRPRARGCWRSTDFCGHSGQSGTFAYPCGQGTRSTQTRGTGRTDPQITREHRVTCIAEHRPGVHERGLQLAEKLSRTRVADGERNRVFVAHQGLMGAVCPR